jgi:hypothetical protein
MKGLNYRIFVVTLLLGLVVFIFPQGICSMENKYWILGSLIVFLLSTLFAMKRVSSSLNVSQAKFNAVYFGTMGLKMLLALIFVIIYLKFSTLVNKYSVVFMLCSYFIFTGFEIQFILAKLRTNSEKDKNGDDARK